MTELIKKYYSIMARYRKGEFGNNHLTVYDILEKAGELDLFDKMSQSEIQFLIDKSSGITKLMFIEIKKSKTNLVINDKQNNLIHEKKILKRK